MVVRIGGATTSNLDIENGMECFQLFSDNYRGFDLAVPNF
jgi:hypothetical protein